MICPKRPQSGFADSGPPERRNLTHAGQSVRIWKVGWDVGITMARRMIIALKGIKKKGEVKRIREALLNTSGVENVEIDIKTGKMRIYGTIDRESAIDVLQQIGYEVTE